MPENIVPDSESMTMAISRRQAIIAASFEVLAVIMLLASGAFFLFWNELFHRDQNSTNSHDSVFTLIAAVIQWMGALWTAYACGAGVMIYPLLQDCNRMRSFYINNNNNQRRQQQSSTTMHSMFALHCSRAAAVSTAAFSLCTIVGSVLLLPEESSSSSSLSDDDAFLILIVQRLKFWMPCLGMGILSLSSASLMTSFWPSPSQPLEVDAPSRVEEYESLLLPPFLESQPPQQQRQQSSADDDALVRNHGRDDEEMDHYQLLEDGVAMPAATPSTFSNDKDANDKALAASNSCSSDSPVVENSSDTAPSNSSRLRGTRRLLQLAAPQVLYLYAGCAVLLCRLPFSLAMPHFVSTALAAVASGDFRTAHHQVQWLLLSGIVDAALDFWGFFLFGYANQKIVRSLRVDLFRRLLGQEMAFFDVHSSGELTSRLNSDCSEMAGDLTWFFRFSIESVVRITGITAYMLIRSPVLGACALSIIPAVAVINKFYGDWLRHNAVKVQDSLAEANSVAQEALANVRTVIAFVAEHKECQRYESRIERQYQLNIKQLYMTALYYMGKTPDDAIPE